MDIACNLPWHTYIVLCLYSIALWSKFSEPCGIDHCASARTPELWGGHGALSNGLWSWNPSFSDARATPWCRLIFLIWIFWMTPLQSTEADWCFLVPQKTRAQTNTYILRYWWITIPNLHIVSLVLACLLPLPTYIFLCLYSIALWSQFFEPCGMMTLRVSADPWALRGPLGLV